MIKVRIYAAIFCRVIILTVLFALAFPFFLLYVLCLVGETYLNAFFGYITNTREALITYDKQLNP